MSPARSLQRGGHLQPETAHVQAWGQQRRLKDRGGKTRWTWGRDSRAPGRGWVGGSFCPSPAVLAEPSWPGAWVWGWQVSHLCPHLSYRVGPRQEPALTPCSHTQGSKALNSK